MTSVKELLEGKTGEVWTIAPDDTVYHALQIMADKDIGALPVVEGGQLIGILSERDYARRGILQGRGSKDTPVRDLMTTSLHAANLEHSLDRCMTLMTNKHVRHLPVLDQQGALVGVVSIGDVLKAIIREQHEHLAQLELRQPGSHALD